MPFKSTFRWPLCNFVLQWDCTTLFSLNQWKLLFVHKTPVKISGVQFQHHLCKMLFTQIVFIVHAPKPNTLRSMKSACKACCCLKKHGYNWASLMKTLCLYVVVFLSLVAWGWDDIPLYKEAFKTSICVFIFSHLNHNTLFPECLSVLSLPLQIKVFVSFVGP